MVDMIAEGIRKVSFFVLLLMVSACSLDKELDISQLNTSPQYFVECYVRPGELYNLTATEISPIYEEYILDYSLDFDVHIIDTDTVKLFHSLFIEEGTGFIYNYGSGERLDGNLTEVSMLVISPNGDTISAKTSIPQQVDMQEVSIQGDELVVSFWTSDKAEQNYYILISNFSRVGGDNLIMEEHEIQYLELGERESDGLYQITQSHEFFSEAIEITVTLMRVTEENYKYQKSLETAKNASVDNITYPSPLESNIVNGIGIFTAYTEDVMELSGQ